MAIRYTLVGNAGNGEKYLRCTWVFCGLIVRTSFGFKMTENIWDAEKGKMKTGAVNSTGVSAGFINGILKEIKRRCIQVEQIYSGYIDENINLTDEELLVKLKEIISGVIDEAPINVNTNKHRLIPVYLQFMSEEKGERFWTKSTEISYNKLVRYFKEYFPGTCVEDIGLRWMESFFSCLSKRLTERTVRNMLISMKSFLRWLNKHYDCGAEALEFSGKTRDNIRELMFLTIEELQRLVALDIPSSGGQYISENRKTVIRRTQRQLCYSRDMFIFSCMTGLRFSDLQRLEWAHIFRNSLKMHTQKTMKLVEVSLNPVSRGVLDRMQEAGNKVVEGKEYVFPRINNADYNHDLKIIGHLLELEGDIMGVQFKNGKRIETTVPRKDALTTHSGRHTFAVQALSAGVPGSVLMSWTGHSDYNSLKPYMGITSEAKKEGMKRFEGWLSDVFE